MRTIVCLLMLMMLVSCVAWGDTFYSSQAAWTAAVTSTTSVNFEGVSLPPPPGNYNSYGYGPGSAINVGGVQFSVGSMGTDNILFVLGDGIYGFPVATIAPQSTSAGTNDLLITLPSTVTALAFDYSGFVTLTNTTVTLSDGVSVTVPSYNGPTLQFLGVTAAGGVSWVDISVGGYGLNVDGITYGTANPVPEPGSMAFLGSGVLAAAAMVRRKFLV